MPDKHRIRHAEKQAAVNDGRNGQELLLQGPRVSYRPEATVEYIVAIVGDPRLAISAAPQCDLCPQSLQSTGRQGMAKSDDLDWYRVTLSELVHQLTFVHDNEKTRRTGRNNFFAQQRAPGTFDQIELVVHLIGAIHRQIQMRMVIQGGQRNGELGGALGGLYRGGHTSDA